MGFKKIKRENVPEFLKSYKKKTDYSILDIDFDYFANSRWDYTESDLNYIIAFFTAIKNNLSN